MHQDCRLGTCLKNPDQRRQVFLYLKPLIAADLQPMIERERLSPEKHGKLPL